MAGDFDAAFAVAEAIDLAHKPKILVAAGVAISLCKNKRLPKKYPIFQ